MLADKVLRAPREFGRHPENLHRVELLNSLRRRYWDRLTPKERFEIGGDDIDVPISSLIDPLHPSVCHVPRHAPLNPVDENGDSVDAQVIDVPFSSSKLYWDDEDGWVFQELDTDPSWRLNQIHQLSYLVAPSRKHVHFKMRTGYIMPHFIHSRAQHSTLAAIFAEILLARAGFSRDERAPVVLTVGLHDVATPAGGDSVKRVDPEGLDEERNFTWQLRRYNAEERWKRFGFHLEEAAAWVRNEGLWGYFLDIMDKLSYVALDCFHCGSVTPGEVRSFCTQHPLFMDVWQDIAFTDDRMRFAFTDPSRLLNFLMARALEHQEVLLNPYARVMDFHLTIALKPFYLSGDITIENLLTWTTRQLEEELHKRQARGFELYQIAPRELRWQKFSTQEQLDQWVSQHGENTEIISEVVRFNPCLDWPVFTDPATRTNIVPLRSMLFDDQVRGIEEIVESLKGFYAYWFVDPTFTQ